MSKMLTVFKYNTKPYQVHTHTVRVTYLEFHKIFSLFDIFYMKQLTRGNEAPAIVASISRRPSETVRGFKREVQRVTGRQTSDRERQVKVAGQQWTMICIQFPKLLSTRADNTFLQRKERRLDRWSKVCPSCLTLFFSFIQPVIRFLFLSFYPFVFLSFLKTFYVAR